LLAGRLYVDRSAEIGPIKMSIEIKASKIGAEFGRIMVIEVF
jgi:hypothetical protein